MVDLDDFLGDLQTVQRAQIRHQNLDLPQDLKTQSRISEYYARDLNKAFHSCARISLRPNFSGVVVHFPDHFINLQQCFVVWHSQFHKNHIEQQTLASFS